MKVFILELLKLVKNYKLWVMIFILLFINIVVIYSTEPIESISHEEFNISLKKYKETGPDLRDLKEGLIKIYNGKESFNYFDNFVKEIFFIRYLIDYNKELENFPEFLRKIKEDDNSFILSAENSYTSIDNKRIKERYSDIISKKYKIVEERAFNEAVENKFTDLLAFIIILYLVYQIIIYDDENKLISFFKTMKKGNFLLILSKIISIIIFSIFIYFIFSISNFVVSFIKYPGLDLRTNIHAVFGFSKSVFDTNIINMILIFLSFKMLAIIMISAIVIFLSLIFRRLNLVIVFSISIYLFQTLIFNNILTGSNFEFFKFFNIYFINNPVIILKEYFNLNILGKPIDIISFNLFSVIIISLLFLSLAILIYYKKSFDENVKYRYKSPLTKIGEKSLFLNEGYKLLVVNKGFIIIIIFTLFHIGFADTNYYKLSEDEYYFKNFSHFLEGEANIRKDKWLKEKQSEFDEIHKKHKEAKELYLNKKINKEELYIRNRFGTDKLRELRAFNNASQDYKFSKENNLLYIYKKGYDNILNNRRLDFKYALTFIIGLIITLSSYLIFEFKNKSDSIIKTYANYEGYRYNKSKLIIFITTIIFLINYIPLVNSNISKYGLNFIFSSVRNLGVNLNISIFTYLIIVFLIRYITALIIVYIMIFISKKAKSEIMTISIAASLFIIPIFTKLLDLNLFDYISINTFISANMILEFLIK